MRCIINSAELCSLTSIPSDLQHIPSINLSIYRIKSIFIMIIYNYDIYDIPGGRGEEEAMALGCAGAAS
jgi:hypothetical protein